MEYAAKSGHPLLYFSRSKGGISYEKLSLRASSAFSKNLINFDEIEVRIYNTIIFLIFSVDFYRVFIIQIYFSSMKRHVSQFIYVSQ